MWLTPWSDAPAAGSLHGATGAAHLQLRRGLDTQSQDDKAGRSRLLRRAPETLPGIQANVVVVPACQQERGRLAHALHHFEAKHITIKAKRPVEVSYLEMAVADAGLKVDRTHADDMSSPCINFIRGSAESWPGSPWSSRMINSCNRLHSEPFARC